MEHPASSNAFDSLGEAYMKNGDNGLAISSYRMALRIDPTNGHAAVMLKQAGIARVLSLTKAAISTVAILVVAVISTNGDLERPTPEWVMPIPKQRLTSDEQVHARQPLVDHTRTVVSVERDPLNVHRIVCPDRISTKSGMAVDEVIAF